MKWIAHRGASLEMPENTLASLRLGSALGAYAVECDVRRLSDGEYVIADAAGVLRDPARTQQTSHALFGRFVPLPFPGGGTAPHLSRPG